MQEEELFENQEVSDFNGAELAELLEGFEDVRFEREQFEGELLGEICFKAGLETKVRFFGCKESWYMSINGDEVEGEASEFELGFEELKGIIEKLR